jgi:hypothetical protein
MFHLQLICCYWCAYCITVPFFSCAGGKSLGAAKAMSWWCARSMGLRTLISSPIILVPCSEWPLTWVDRMLHWKFSSNWYTMLHWKFWSNWQNVALDIPAFIFHLTSVVKFHNVIWHQTLLEMHCKSFFFRITQYDVDAQYARTLTPMNTRM